MIRMVKNRVNKQNFGIVLGHKKKGLLKHIKDEIAKLSIIREDCLYKVKFKKLLNRSGMRGKED